MTTQVLPQAVLDAYDVGGLLGAGGHGVAYRAVDRSSGAPVAIKALHATLDSPEEVRAFTEEANAMHRLHGRSEVVQLHRAFVAEGRPILVMELLAGTLAERLASLGTLDPTEVRTIAGELLDAVVVAHDAGVVHADITPANVFMRPNGAIVLADFGVARVDDVTLTGGAGVSLGYVAPETVELGEVTNASDLYGVGATLYALLSGHPPFVEERDTPLPIGVLVRRIADPEMAELPPGVPADLAGLIAALMAHRPSDRPSSAREALALLRTPQAGSDPTAPAPTVPAPTVRAHGRAGAIAVALLGVIALVVGGVWLANRPSDTGQVAAAVDPEPTRTLAGPEESELVSSAVERTVSPVSTVGDATTPDETVADGIAAVVDTAAAPATTAPATTAPATTATPATTAGETTTVAPATTASQTTLAPQPTVAAGGCALLCETFETLDGWQLQQDASVARLSLERSPRSAGGSVLRQTSGSGTEPGGSYLERSLGAIGNGDDLHVRVSLAFDDLPPSDSDRRWFQNLFVVTDELRHSWSLNVRHDSNGDLSFHGAYGDPANEDYGGTFIVAAAPTDHIFCLQLTVPVSSGGPATYTVDGTPMRFPDAGAQQYGSAFVLQVGPTWLDEQDLAPGVMIDEVIASTEPVGCSE